jgi:trimethylamine:corrinoid methyltransferase-like protein
MAERTIRTVKHREHPLDILTEDQLHRIQEASLDVLERTGIEVRSEVTLKELGKRAP